MMPSRRTSRKPTVSKTGVEPRHQYVPWDHVKDQSWKMIFPEVDPLIPVTLDRGTFEWLWDFVSRKGRQADADNFHYSDIHRDVYRRAADQFANAAKEAFGDVYLVQESKAPAKGRRKPAEAPVEPSKARKRRKPRVTTAKAFEASTEPSKPIRRRRRRKPRSEA